jgi:hypothetical protein
MPIFDALIKPALDSVTALISQFHLSPEDKLKAEQAIANAAQQARQQSQDYDVQLNSIASQNIRADATTGDKFTERARPWFMYIIEAVLAFNYIVFPLLHAVRVNVATIELPSNLLELFGVCVTGYVFNRTAEKISALPGDSQINVLGIKVGNKS